MAICPSTRRCSQPQALTLCSADRPLARSNERRGAFPSIATTPGSVSENVATNRWKAARNCSGSSRRNRRLKVSWLGRSFSNFRKPRRNGSFATANAAPRLRKGKHVRRTLPAAQHGAQGDHQQFVAIVQTGIAGPRVLQPLKAGNKLVQQGLPRRLWLARARTDCRRIGQGLFGMSREFQVRFPWHTGLARCICGSGT